MNQVSKIVDVEDIGSDWLLECIDSLTEELIIETPVEYNERVRYLPRSVTSIAGYINFDVNPFMREIIDATSLDSPVRQITVKKGVQISYTTALESILLYHLINTGLPAMFMSADKELATARVANNIIPMLTHSGLINQIQSPDTSTGNRKTGMTKDFIQFKSGSYLTIFGARNADKMRSFSISLLLKDELDAWPLTVGRDGDPDKLSDSRCDAYPFSKKIVRGSTPLLKESSMIEKNYIRGDQRKYFVPCKHCHQMQFLVWRDVNTDTGVESGFLWDYNENGSLDIDSVRYACIYCQGEHKEGDKHYLLSNGEWRPTATSIEPNIRSYHLPAFYAPMGFRPWSQSVQEFLECYNPLEKKVKDMGRYQVFVNNVLAEPFEIRGFKLTFLDVSNHRRSCYGMGEIPNNYAKQYTGSSILFLTLSVDVHKSFLAAAVIGWTQDQRNFVIDYKILEDADCTRIESPVWDEIRDLIEYKIYAGDDGQEYRILRTFIDAGYTNSMVIRFCGEYASNVFPTLGRDRAEKSNTIKEFATFTTRAGTLGFKISVDLYKDRIATALRDQWTEESETLQPNYLFSGPSDLSDAAIKELTAETLREKKHPNGTTTHYWHRPGNRRNELFDLLVLGHAAVETFAYQLCIEHFELETINWEAYWAYAKEPVNDALFGRIPKMEKANSKQ